MQGPRLLRLFIAYDGGPADNLGVRTLMTVLDQSLKNRAREEVFPRGCWIISVDATGRFDNLKQEPLSAATVLLKSHRREVLELAGHSGGPTRPHEVRHLSGRA